MKKDENKKDYMEFIQEWERKYIPKTPEEESEFEYVGNPEDLENEEYFDDEFIIIDENEEDDYELPSCIEDEEILDIPQGEYEELSAIDENYVPDEWEKDLFDSPENDIIENVESIEQIIEKEDLIGSSIKINDSIVEKEDIANRRNKIDDKIAKNIAKEVLDEKSLSSVNLVGTEEEDEQPDWINQDMFGNDIESIIAEPPQDEEKHDDDDDFVEGTFDKWREENK